MIIGIKVKLGTMLSMTTKITELKTVPVQNSLLATNTVSMSKLISIKTNLG